MATNLGDFPLTDAHLEVGFTDEGTTPSDPSFTIQRLDPASGPTTVSEGTAFANTQLIKAGLTTTIIGSYTVRLYGGAPRVVDYTRRFEMYDPSGDSSGENGAGRIIAVQAFEKPEVRHLVWQTSNGDLVVRKNAS